jgi:hypothetical protein
MKNISFVIIVFLLISLAMSGCSKSSSNLIGKWKADSVAGMPKDLETQIYYEFTKEKIIATGTVHGEPLDKAEIPYTLKSEEGKTLVLSVVHPVTGAQGEFKLTVDGNKMNMLDPDNKPFIFTKVE